MSNMRSTLRMPVLDNLTGEMFCRFVTGLVHRVNMETFQVEIQEVKVDFSLTGFQAEIDKSSKILTISAFAVESMPKRLSRCFIIQQLAGFLYSSESEEFAREIALFEPNYQSLIKQFEISFSRNLKEGLLRADRLEVSRSTVTGELERPRLLVAASKKTATTSVSYEIARHLDELLANSKDKPGMATVNKFDAHCTDDIKTNTKNGAIPPALV